MSGDAVPTVSGFDEVARQARILSPMSYRFDETVVQDESPPMTPASNSIPPIVWRLQHHLYERCYLGRREAGTAQTLSLTDLTATLSAANPLSARWDHGWVIQRIDPKGLVLVAREGKSRVVHGGEFLNAAVGVPPSPGSSVSLFVPHESASMQAGFYFAMGDSLGDHLEELAIARFYWNVRADEAPGLLRRLSEGLSAYSIPFRLKVLSARELFPRPDALVLYVAERYARITASLCAAEIPLLDSMRGRAVPLFTKRLTDGLGAAEDPGNGESFGMSRCRVAAEGLWNAFVSGTTESEAVVGVVRQHAARYGLDPDRPYLNPRSPDLFDLPRDDD